MATALDKNGREVRVGDRICSTIDPAYIGTAAEVPCGTLGIRVSYDTDHAYAEAREWYSAPENLKLLNAPPLVKDANGNELRVGDRVKLTATGYEASVHRVTASPVVELCEYAAGQPFYALSVNTMRLTPPPPAKDAAEGALWGGDGQSRPLTDIERVRRANADGIPDKPYDINGRLLAVGDRVESTGALCHERRTGEVVEVSVALFGKPLANVIKVRQDDGRTTSSAAGLWRYTAHTRDSEGLRGIVQPGASRFDAGHLAAYHAAIGATHQDYRDACDTLGVVSTPYPVDGKDGGTWVPVVDATSAHDTRPVYRTEAHDLATQATRIRELARERIRERYATCDWDDPVRIADAEDYVLGLVGLVARVERDFVVVGELGVGFRQTPRDTRGYWFVDESGETK